MTHQVEHATSSTTICPNSEVWLTSNSKGFDNITTVSWDMGDGTISPGLSHPSLGNYIIHTYNDVNSYDVTLTIEHDETIEVLHTFLIYSTLTKMGF